MFRRSRSILYYASYVLMYSHPVYVTLISMSLQVQAKWVKTVSSVVYSRVDRLLEGYTNTIKCSKECPPRRVNALSWASNRVSPFTVQSVDVRLWRGKVHTSYNLEHFSHEQSYLRAFEKKKKKLTCEMNVGGNFLSCYNKGDGCVRTTFTRICKTVIIGKTVQWFLFLPPISLTVFLRRQAAANGQDPRAG